MMQRKIDMFPRNDQSCGWVECLEPREAFPVLQGDKRADWVIVGGGYTGLSFARRMASARPDDRIIIVDAQLIGEGASARNSGFAVVTSCFDTSYKERRLEEFRRVNRLNKAGIDTLREIVMTKKIDCQWSECGKVHIGAQPRTERAADDYIDWLEAAGVDYEDLSGADLSRHLGTSYYRRGIWTKADVMLQPAALARGLARSLPENVALFERSPVVHFFADGQGVDVQCPLGNIRTNRLVLASNGFLHAMTPQKSHTVPLVLTASLSRPLTKDEQAILGHPDEWGGLSLIPTGATLRYTRDHRIMVRNTVAYSGGAWLNEEKMQTARQRHETGLQQRFPMLDKLSIEYSWQGVTCVSRNGSFLFGKLHDRIYGAGCYSGSGVSKGCTLGILLADLALDRTSSLLDDALHTPAPSWIPPRPLLDLAMKAELRRRKLGTGVDA